MHVLLQHPRAHRDFVDFALAEMRGVLRPEVYNPDPNPDPDPDPNSDPGPDPDPDQVYNHASAMLQRVRAAQSAG